jgi:hypothetical protein
VSDPDYKGFAIAIMDGFPEPFGEQLDGCDLQEVATKYGLLRKEPTKVPCGESCQCAEYWKEGETADCYRINWDRSGA